MKTRFIGMLALASIGFTSMSAQAAYCTGLTTQMSINQCLNKQLQASDRQLGKVYNGYMKTLSKSQQTNLRAAQRLWVQFKEKDCQYVASHYQGGSMQPAVLAQCLIDRAETREQELRDMQLMFD